MKRPASDAFHSRFGRLFKNYYLERGRAGRGVGRDGSAGLPAHPAALPPGPGLQVLQGEVHDGHQPVYLAHRHTAAMITDLAGFTTV